MAMNHLIWGGCDTVDLAGRYGTPLYVMDETMLRDRCRRLSAAVAGRNARVCYAGKAFLNVAGRVPHRLRGGLPDGARDAARQR